MPIVMLMPTKNSRKPSRPFSVRSAPMPTAPTMEMIRFSSMRSPSGRRPATLGPPGSAASTAGLSPLPTTLS